MPLTSAGSELCRMFWPFARQLTLRENNWLSHLNIFSFLSIHQIFIELFDPIPCLPWYVGLILVFCLTSRFRLSSKFSAFPAFIIDNINISAKTLNWKWISFNLIRKKQRQKDTIIDVNKNLQHDGENWCYILPQIMLLHIFLLCINKNTTRERRYYCYMVI